MNKMVMSIEQAIKGRSVSDLIGQSIGYAKGYPWGLLPVAAYSALKAKVSPDKEDDKNTKVLLEMMKRGANQFCCLIWQTRGFYSAAAPYVPAKYYKSSDPDFPKTKAASIDLDGLKLQYGINDFDAPDRRMNLLYRAIYLLLRLSPKPQVDHIPLPPIEEYKAILDTIFGETFIAYRAIEGDPDDPKILCRYFTHDYGAPWLKRENELFVADLSHWEDAELKHKGKYHENYGGRLEFDAEMNNVSITWKGKRYRPQDEGWSKVRYIMVSTALLAVVLENHTLHVHFLNAALFSLKSRTHLDPNHPVHRLLRPFTLRTVAINEHAIHSILTESGILFHGSALTWKSIKRLYKHAADTYQHIPVPEELKAKGLLESDGTAAKEVAFAEESLEAYSIIERFVSDYIDLYYADDASISNDEKLKGFYSEIVNGLPTTAGVPEALTKSSLIDLISVFIWNSTFWHDYTSQTGNSLADYRLGAVLIKKEERYGSFYPNMQEHLVTLLAHQLTTVEGNKIVDNFHHFWLDDDAVEVGLKFQQDLWNYRDNLEKRNEERDFIFNAYDPAIIESSVQT